MMATEMKADLKGFELLNDELEDLSGIREANKILSDEEYSTFLEKNMKI